MGKALSPKQQTACRLLREYFFSRIDIVAARQSWLDRKTKERVARPRPVKGEGSLDDLIAYHVIGPSGGKAPPLNYTNRKTSGQVADGRGFDRLGSYAVSTDDTAAWLCMDFDGPSAGHSKGTTLADPQATMLVCYDHCRRLGIPAHIEKSGSGVGWHLWVFFEEPVPAVDARMLGHFIAPTDQPLATGEIADVRIHRGIECFPKQNKVSDKKIGAGNLVWLPFWFGAKDGGNRFHVVDGDGNLILHDPTGFERFSVADLATILDQVPDDLRNLVLKKKPKRPASKSKPPKKSQGTPTDYAPTDSDLVVAAMDSISPDCSYDEWLRIGMALHEWDPQAGLSIWDSWSTRGEKYVGGETEEKWAGFSSGGGVTLGTLFDMAKKAGWIPPAHERTPLPTDEEIAEFMDVEPEELVDKHIAPLTPERQEIFNCLLQTDTPLGPREISKILKKDYWAVQKALTRMSKSSQIEKNGHGKFRVLDTSPVQTSELDTPSPVQKRDLDMSSSDLDTHSPVQKAALDTPRSVSAMKLDTPGDGPRLPTIIVNNRHFRHTRDEAWAAVQASNYPPKLFQRTGSPVCLAFIKGVPEIAPVDSTIMFDHLCSIASWVRRTPEMELPANPPKELPMVMVKRPQPFLPALESVTATPTFDQNGNLVQTPGYHRDARLWFHRSTDYEPVDVPVCPTKSQISNARSLLLDDLLTDFPFTAESDCAHTVAALLLPFVRRMIQGPTPLHLIEAPTPGTGKTLLAETISRIVQTKPAEVTTIENDERENSKKITALLSTAPQVILIDNIRVGLRSSQLAAALTSEIWCDRILGFSQMTRLPNSALWIATANNPSLSLEIARRCVRIRIDPRIDRPWQREGFKHDPLRDWVNRHHTDLVHAALILVRSWIAAGKPEGTRTIGSFESWARVIGGILHFAEIPGFLGNIEELYENADHEGNEWREFTVAWWDRFGPRFVPAAELLELATERSLLSATIGDKGLQSQKIRLGRALSAMRDRQFDIYRITTQRDTATKKQLYGLVNSTMDSAQQPARVIDLFSERAGDSGELKQLPVNSPEEKAQQNQGSPVSRGVTGSVPQSAHAHTQERSGGKLTGLTDSPETTRTPGEALDVDLNDFDDDPDMDEPIKSKEQADEK